MPILSRPPNRTAALVAVLSAAILIPCFWQSAIQAGDLGSHAYNAWLHEQIQTTGLPGLVVTTKYTNVLFDVFLSFLSARVGLDAAQRIAVSVTVLTFFWGSFAFLRALAGRAPWELTPVLGILTYGTMFQAGFLNYLLGCGLAAFGAALLIAGGTWRLVGSCLALAIAATANVIPAVWLCGCAVFARIPSRFRLAALASGLVGIAAWHVLITRILDNPFPWTAAKIATPLALDQAGLYSPGYMLIGLGLAGTWVSAAFRNRSAVTGVPGLLLVMAVALALFTPETILHIPGYHCGIGLMDLRLTLFVALAWCVIAAAGAPSRIRSGLGVVCAATFFVFLWQDHGTANRLESILRSTVQKLPPGSRIVSALYAPTLRVDVLRHTLDRACVGQCYSFLNYEPSSSAFRVVATGPNPYVLASWPEMVQIERNGYRVKASDLPMYELRVAPDLASATARTLRAGDVIRFQTLDVFTQR